MIRPTPIPLFEAYGVELEYMIVDAKSLDVLPVTDKVLFDVVGEYASDLDAGAISWSNELALHVIELKTTDPARSLGPLPGLFQEQIERIGRLLQSHGGRLMPTAMHPWMDPDREMQLWPHENNTVYSTFDRIFNCCGHGWANLQSVHLNLPFANDVEFGKLHTAIRLLVPIMPALAASSPIVERRVTNVLDNRLNFYRSNASRVPSVTGLVVPEPATTRHEYETQILERIYKDLAPYDPEGVLRHEWANARGAIARFDRNTIEVRVLDVQECPQADVAICTAISSVLKMLVDERWTPAEGQLAMSTESLAAILLEVMRDADQAVIRDRVYLAQFGIEPTDEEWTAGKLWGRLFEAMGLDSVAADEAWEEPLRTIATHGPLARRIIQALGPNPDEAAIRRVYHQLCDCLQDGRMFVPHG